MTELGARLPQVFRALSRLRGRDTHLGGSELSHAQFELLIELDERGELPAGELAAAARLTPATVTQMLDHLAACGHVERVRSEVDRRVVVSRLTPWATADRGQAQRLAGPLEAALADVPSAICAPPASPGPARRRCSRTSRSRLLARLRRRARKAASRAPSPPS